MPDIDEEDVAEFKKAAKRLDSLMNRIKRKCPSARYYVTSGTLNLMKGPSHSDEGGKFPMYENVVEEVAVRTIDGGDW